MIPSLSVCVPTYNGARTLAETLASVAAQTHRPDEVVVADDGSVDDTLAIAESFANRLPLRIVADGGRGGLARNWMRSVEAATSDLIKFVFQDDLLAPACVEHMATAIGDCDLAVCARDVLYDGVDAARRAEFATYHRWSSLRSVLGGGARLSPDQVSSLILHFPIVNVLGEPALQLFRRDALLAEPADPVLIQALDYDMASRVALRRGLVFVDETLATFRVHGESATADNVRRRRFSLEVVDPARLVARYSTHPSFSPMRDWIVRSGADLDGVMDDVLGLAWEQVAKDQDLEAQWAAVLADEPALAAHWAPPHAPPRRRGTPSLARRIASWSMLGVRHLRSRLSLPGRWPATPPPPGWYGSRDGVGGTFFP